MSIAGAFRAGCVLASSMLAGCGALLAIPDDPYIDAPVTPTRVDIPSKQTEPPNTDAVGSSEPLEPDASGSGLDTHGPAPSELLGGGAMDSGAAGAESDPPPSDGGANEADAGIESCVARSQRRPVDILMVADNSGSMAAEIDALERRINPDFAAVLDAAGVDFQLVLLSRQRVAARTASEDASSSICVTSPLSSLASCPAPAPVSNARFLHYSAKIDATDSFDRILDTFAAPDPFGFTASGWSERLRPDAIQIMIELTDADATLPLNDFLTRLTALSPARFGTNPAAPRFVFHSVLGVLQKTDPSAGYAPQEPVELRRCADPTGADNAGPSYQALSRLTGGLRFPICAGGAAMPAVLQALANDAVERSFVACPAPTQSGP